MPDAPGRLMLFFGARRPEELPYFGPLQKVPDKLLGKHFCYSRVEGQPRVYVQDRIRSEAAAMAALLAASNTHVYICGLKGMESGVDEAFADVCRAASLDWTALKPSMRDSGRYHVETY
jgi:benzoyl-CoA 2,3-dioxygenase component A